MKKQISQSKSLLELLKSYARKELGYGKDVYGVSVAGPKVAAVERIISNFNPPSLQLAANAFASRESFESYLLENPDSGKVLSFDGDVSSKKEAKSDEIRDAEIIAIPGLTGGESSTKLHETFQSISKIFPERKSLVYSPIDEGAGRFVRLARGSGYYVQSGFINEEESSNVFNTIIRPKFFDESQKLLQPEDCPRLTLVNFSIGAREAESHWHFFLRELLNSGVSGDDVKKYSDKIAFFNIGCPRNWKSFDVTRPRTSTIYSVEDFGCRKPSEFLQDIHFNPNFGDDPAAAISRHGFANNKETLVLLGRGQISGERILGVGPNLLGHALPHYSAAICDKDAPVEVREVVNAFNAFADRSVPDKEAKRGIDEFTAKATPHRPYLEVNERDFSRTISAVYDYMLTQEELQSRGAKTSDVASGGCDERIQEMPHAKRVTPEFGSRQKPSESLEPEEVKKLKGSSATQFQKNNE